MTSDRGTILLYGGAGYVGAHLRREMRLADYRVVIVDRNLSSRQTGTDACQLDQAPGPGITLAMHLACPRNRPGMWDWDLAERSFTQGQEYIEKYTEPGTPKFYASSWSIKDVPDNEYSRFKRMAEEIVKAGGWEVVRFPTLFGIGAPDLPFREDLGLNRVIAAWARHSLDPWTNAKPWVNRTTVRHLMPIDMMVRRLRLIFEGKLFPSEMSLGKVRFSEVAWDPFEIRDCEGGYTTTHGEYADVSHVVACRNAFLRTANYLLGDKVEKI